MPRHTEWGRSKTPEQKAQIARWEALLAAEGMPADLAPYFEDADTAPQAARAYAQDRMYEANARGFDSTGEHARMAQAIAAQFGISEEQAMATVESEFDRVDRLRRAHDVL